MSDHHEENMILIECQTEDDCRKKRKQVRQEQKELADLLALYVEEHDAAARSDGANYKECPCEPCSKAHSLLERLHGRQNQLSPVRDTVKS